MKVSKAMAMMISTARPDDTVAWAAALEVSPQRVHGLPASLIRVGAESSAATARHDLCAQFDTPGRRHAHPGSRHSLR